MENKTEWYRKLLRKLNKIKSGELDLDEYIDEVKAKIEAESQALSMSGVIDSAYCQCHNADEKLFCTIRCPDRTKIIQS